MYLRLLIIIFLGITMYGCAGSPARIASMSSEELHSVDESQLCSTYFYKSNENLSNEISRRKLITESEWNSVKNEQITLGMKRCSVLAALGRPHMAMRKPIGEQKSIEALVFTVESGSVYPAYSKQRTTTVYLVDGLVTKIDKNW